MAKSQPAEFRRPKKQSRRRAVVPRTGEVRVPITKTPNMVNDGFHPEASFLRKGYEIDEKSKSPNGQRFDVVISAEKFNALRAKNDEKTRALEGKSRKGRDSTGGVNADVEVEVVKETISGATMRRELAAADAASASAE